MYFIGQLNSQKFKFLDYYILLFFREFSSVRRSGQTPTMENFAELKNVIESVELVDGHAHNLVALDSTVPFLNCFSEATGEEALSYVPHTINFKVRSLFLFSCFSCFSCFFCFFFFSSSGPLFLIFMINLMRFQMGNWLFLLMKL